MVELSPPHRDLTWMTPLSEGRAARLVRFLTSGPCESVLDVGCGWAELLLRVLEAAPAAVGRGIDSDEAAIAHGRSVAADRGIDGRVELIVSDARSIDGRADAVLCIGASQVWGPPVEDAQPLDYAAALSGLRGLVTTGGRVVYGEGIWSRPPTPAAIEPLAGRTDEFVSLAQLLEIAVGHGFAVTQVHEADQDEWDTFESGYAACYARWLVEHGSDHPDAEEARAAAGRQRAAYFGGYRGVLGLAYLCLEAV